MIDSEVVESVEQFASMWRVFVSDRGNADVRDLPGVAVRWVDSKFPFWNTIVLTDRGASRELLTDRLTEAAAYMRSKDHGGLIWVFEEYLQASARAELPTIAAQIGLTFSLTCHGMAGDFLPIQEPSHPALEFVRVTNEAHLKAYADINSKGYGFALEVGRDGLQWSNLWEHGMYAYLGLENGVPVSAAATVANDGSLFLALVATTPAAQGRGYGAATVRKALFEGARATGLTRTVLHATDAGLTVYRRMGYRKVANILCYELAARH